MHKPRILVMGSLVMDLISRSGRLPQAGETVLGEAFSAASGGKGANQAMQAALLGAEVAMMGNVGTDSFGRQMCASLAEAGVNIDHIATVAGPSGVGNVQLSENGNRITVLPGANMGFTAEDTARLRDMIGGFDMLLLQLEIPLESNLAAAEIAHAAGVPVMLNPAPAAALPDALFPLLTCITPNEHEASALTGIAVTDEKTAEKAASCLLEKGVQRVVITMGDRGAAYCDRAGFRFVPAAHFGTAVDPTAAGDSFIGAFCTLLCAGAATEEALAVAVHAAAVTVCGTGAQPSLPTADTVLAFLQRDGVASAALSALAAAQKTPALQLADFNACVLRETENLVKSMDTAALQKAADRILAAKRAGNRLHITGIGKPAHIAGYIASLFSSTGTPTYFLHGTEAVHGSAGQLERGDIVICISNSGETAEMKATVQAIKNNGCTVIGVSGNASSRLAREAALHLTAHVDNEGGPLNRAPRASILAETLLLQALSVLLQAKSSITPQNYVRRHPGGALGKLRDNEK